MAAADPEFFLQLYASLLFSHEPETQAKLNKIRKTVREEERRKLKIKKEKKGRGIRRWRRRKSLLHFFSPF